MSLTIPGDILQAAHMSDSELRQELAILLFQQERLTLAQASRLAAMDLLRFQHLLASRGISVHYDLDDFERVSPALYQRALEEVGEV
jgi:predicted HTH domain antitoxin